MNNACLDLAVRTPSAVDALAMANETVEPMVYTYNFCLTPESNAPSGYCNFSRFDRHHLSNRVRVHVPVAWSRHTHNKFDAKKKQVVKTFLLVMRRLEVKGATPRLPPEMCERILEVRPAELCVGWGLVFC